jgi:hypothetical protein
MMVGLVAVAGFSALSARADTLKAVVFDLEFAGSPMEGPSGIAPERLHKASEAIKAQIATSGQLTLVDIAPAKAEIEKNLPLRNCNGCDLDIAKSLGADVEVTTALQKSSDVILAFSGSIRDVKTGKVVATGVVDVRGNGDDAWNHGIKFLVKDRLLDPPLPASPEALRAALDK